MSPIQGRGAQLSRRGSRGCRSSGGAPAAFWPCACTRAAAGPLWHPCRSTCAWGDGAAPGRRRSRWRASQVQAALQATHTARPASAIFLMKKKTPGHLSLQCCPCIAPLRKTAAPLPTTTSHVPFRSLPPFRSAAEPATSAARRWRRRRGCDGARRGTRAPSRAARRELQMRLPLRAARGGASHPACPGESRAGSSRGATGDAIGASLCCFCATPAYPAPQPQTQTP